MFQQYLSMDYSVKISGRSTSTRAECLAHIANWTRCPIIYWLGNIRNRKYLFKTLKVSGISRLFHVISVN